jgi:hypothetical protein
MVFDSMIVSLINRDIVIIPKCFINVRSSLSTQMRINTMSSLVVMVVLGLFMLGKPRTIIG